MILVSWGAITIMLPRSAAIPLWFGHSFPSWNHDHNCRNNLLTLLHNCQSMMLNLLCLLLILDCPSSKFKLASAHYSHRSMLLISPLLSNLTLSHGVPLSIMLFKQCFFYQYIHVGSCLCYTKLLVMRWVVDWKLMR